MVNPGRILKWDVIIPIRLFLLIFVGQAEAAGACILIGIVMIIEKNGLKDGRNDYLSKIRL